MGVLSMGKGRQVMTFELPRPCRYVNLTIASESGSLPDLALIADGEPREFAAMVGAWRSVAPSTQLCIFHVPADAESVRMAIGADAAIKAIEVPSLHAIQRLSQAVKFPVWASFAPYDAYGELIKKDLESISYCIINSNRGIYLAHDPAFAVLRWFDANGLRDRLRYRGLRLLTYRGICYAGLVLALISSLFSSVAPKWRKIR